MRANSTAAAADGGLEREARVRVRESRGGEGESTASWGFNHARQGGPGVGLAAEEATAAGQRAAWRQCPAALWRQEGDDDFAKTPWTF